MGNKINIEEYFEKGTFTIPEYQRGYKWSVEDNQGKSSLKYFIGSLVDAFKNNLKEYFIEAVTVVEDDKGNIILVDGQQRTTSLFLLFFVLDDKDFIRGKLVYSVRKDSHKWLNNLTSNQKETIEDEDVQDIFYFDKAKEQIENKLKTIIDEKENFLKFIKEKIYLLYNLIPKEKAVNTFIALNGLKAIMKDQELIKSDLLIKSSRPDEKIKKEISTVNEGFGAVNDLIAIEWKINEDRGRLARNWDKWLYWWNQKNVRDYFGIDKKQHPLYYLLITYWDIEKRDAKKEHKFSFDNFKSEFITDAKTAKCHFEGLRKLQKTFEDLYNNWESYNLLGLAMNTKIQRKDILEFFIQNREKKDELKRFVKWSFVECTLKEINENSVDKFNERRSVLRSLLTEKDLYESKDKEKNQAYLQLLRMNVLAMNKRKFDFDVFETKSLEHICPQNPPESNKDFFDSQKEINDNSNGINSIGNLVLLNGSTNSSLSNNPFNRKKQLLFDKIKEGFLLPHTLKVFSKSFKTETIMDETEKLFDNEKYWWAQNVEDNKNYFFDEFNDYYGK